MEKNIVIEARRWFERTNGNTYHSVNVYVNGECVGREPFAYGYGEHYLQTALNILQDAGVYLPTFSWLQFRQEMREHRSNFVVTCADVGRKKDL